MAAYGFEHEGKVYSPDGVVELGQGQTSAERNADVECKELEWLKTGPDKVFLYVQQPPKELQDRAAKGPGMNAISDMAHAWKLTTWPGTVVSHNVGVGPSVNVGGIAGHWARKRSIDCRIFGVRYVGWYYETAGDYCRLRKAKVQQ